MINAKFKAIARTAFSGDRASCRRERGFTREWIAVQSVFTVIYT
ncbi:hypothetical protein V0288_21425 [Pannus brasiliensis CCIBt3594]|uniref:Uncharacterized protein n=1 Tax=Pannus brasiliensis CCIBt3594 TaxID=1427578 RepID=A0AAW9R0E2_9CHRO